MNPLVRVLRKVRVRLALAYWMRVLVKSLLVGSGAACGWLVLTRLFPILGDAALVSAGLMAAGVVAASGIACFRRPSLLDAALESDRRVGLRERFTSSFELADAQGPMIEALHEDARNCLSRLVLRRDFPLVPPRTTRWLAAIMVAYLVGSVALPEFDLLGYRTRQAQAKARAEATQVTVERLGDAARVLREKLPELPAASAPIAGELDRIAQGILEGKLTDKQAVAKISNLTKDLAAERAKLGALPLSPNKESGSRRLDKADAEKLGAASGLAGDLKQRKYGEAADKLRKIEEQLARGDLSQEAANALAKDLGELARMLDANEGALAEALAKAAAGLNAQDLADALAALKAAQLSLEDLASLMGQFEMYDKVLAQLRECHGKLGCKGCAACRGLFAGADGDEFGPGMGRRGHGRGGRVGDLPDIEAGFKPELLPGEVTKGKILASIMQRAVPEENQESAIQSVSDAFVEVKQEAEQALTKEEIPPGAREVVRQYFGSLEPSARPGQPAP